MQQSAKPFQPKGSTGSPAYEPIGHAMQNLFTLYLIGKEGIKGPNTKMRAKLMRFCKVWSTLW